MWQCLPLSHSKPSKQNTTESLKKASSVTSDNKIACNNWATIYSNLTLTYTQRRKIVLCNSLSPEMKKSLIFQEIITYINTDASRTFGNNTVSNLTHSQHFNLMNFSSLCTFIQQLMRIRLLKMKGFVFATWIKIKVLNYKLYKQPLEEESNHICIS